jgi:hypothetical protein
MSAAQGMVSFAGVEFVADPGITGFEMALVSQGPEGSVRFWRIPEGWNIGQLGVRENLHVHRNVFEYAAVLSGRLPHIEYDLETRERHKIEFSPGQLMIRPNGSIHGLNDSLTVQETCTILYWNTGTGTSLLDSDYHVETADVLGDDPQERVVHAGVCRISDVLGERDGTVQERWTRYSRDGEPMEVSVGRLAAGEQVPLRELSGESPLFAFLWEGACELVDGSGDTREALAQWSLLDGGSLQDARGCIVSARTDAVWLRVERGAPSTARDDQS